MAKVLVDKDRLLALEEVCEEAVKSSDIEVGTDYVSDYEQAGQKQMNDSEGR